MPSLRICFHKFYFFLCLIVISSYTISCDRESRKEEAVSALFIAGLLSSEDTSCPPEVIPSGYFLADQVIDSPGAEPSQVFGDPKKAVNGVCGGGQTSGGFDVYSFATYLTLGWSGKKIQNGEGIDFIVFENGFRISGTNDFFFMEPFFVEVGNDNVHWCGFDPKYLGSAVNASFRREDWLRFGGLTPVIWNMGTKKISPDQLFSNSGSYGYMGEGGGDGFDLDGLSSENQSYGTVIGCDISLRDEIRTNGFSMIRFTSVQYRNGAGSGGSMIPKPQSSFDGKVDIDGVIAKRVK